MDYKLNPNLQITAALRIAIEMWKQSNDARGLTMKQKSIWESEVKKIREKLLEEVSQLAIPPPLQTIVKTAIEPIGKEIVAYVSGMLTLYAKNFETLNWLDYLCWTPFGLIDKKRTAESFLGKGFFSLYARYPLACEYICEDFITVLWKELPQNKNKCGVNVDISSKDCSEKCLVKYWATTERYLLNDNLGRELVRKSIVDCAKSSINKNNPTAFAYFWEKLKFEEKENCLVELARISVKVKANPPYFGKLSIIPIFLISRMNEKQQMELFESHSYSVLKYLADFWLFHDFFMSTVKKVWGLLRDRDVCFLLVIIAQKLNENPWEVVKYEKWFHELWTNSSTKRKEYVVKDPAGLFIYLGNASNFNCLKLMIDETNGEGRKDFFRSPAMKQMCNRLMVTGKWEFFNQLLTCSFSSEEVRDVTRQFLLDPFTCCELILNENWMALDKLLNYFGDLSEERICELKRQLVLVKVERIYYLLPLDENELGLVEKFLNWASSSTEEVTEFKKM